MSQYSKNAPSMSSQNDDGGREKEGGADGFEDGVNDREGAEDGTSELLGACVGYSTPN